MILRFSPICALLTITMLANAAMAQDLPPLPSLPSSPSAVSTSASAPTKIEAPAALPAAPASQTAVPAPASEPAKKVEPEDPASSAATPAGATKAKESKKPKTTGKSKAASTQKKAKVVSSHTKYKAKKKVNQGATKGAAQSMSVVPLVPAKREETSTAPRCVPSDRVAVANYPGAAKIPTGNNLLQPAGKAIEAEGQKLVIHGRVLDSQCAPVPNAVVELWQNDAFGQWILAERADLATPDAIFAGAGRTYTNQDGEFVFITAFPAPIGYRAPFVSLKVSGDKLNSISTALFFSNDSRNDTDIVYRELSEKTRRDTTIHVQEGATDTVVGTIDIILAGKAPYRTY